MRGCKKRGGEFYKETNQGQFSDRYETEFVGTPNACPTWWFTTRIRTVPYRDWSVSRSGGNEPDRNGLFATVMNGPVDVAGNRITGVLDQTRLSPGMQAALFGQREETGLCQSGDRHIGFDALSYRAHPVRGLRKPIFRFQPKPTQLNSPPGFRWQARARCGI